MGKNPHIGHRERIKNRYIKEGLDHFEEHQVLELLLFYAIPYKDTNELSHRLLEEFGSLANLFESSVQQIEKRGNVSLHVATLLSLPPSLTRKYIASKWGDHPVLSTTKKAGEYATSLFYGKTSEAFYVIAMDPQQRVIHRDLIGEGTPNETRVYIRKVIESILMAKATHVILAHNHPSGRLHPSQSDIDLTQAIKTCLEHMEIELIDHLIVAGEKYFSCADHNFFREPKPPDNKTNSKVNE